MKHIAVKLVLSGLAILMAIAPVPFEKWAWQRIAFGILGLAGMVSTKSEIDREMEEQHLVDVQIFEEKLYERDLAQVQRGLALEAARQQEAIRFGLQTKMATADYQGAFVTIMEEKHPYYLDALQAQQQAALEAQSRNFGGSTGAQESGLAIEQVERLDGKLVDPQLAAIRGANPGLDFYDFDDLENDAVGILIGGNSGSGKTSVAAWIAGKLTEGKPAQVFALDPHFNDIWEQLGIHSIGEFHEIEETLDLLVDELDARRTRKKLKQSLGDTIICFTDELNGCIETASDPKKYKKALRRLGSEGRKFGIMLIGLCQSILVEDLGITGSMRGNYFIVCLGRSAKYQSGQVWKPGDPNREWIAKQAYPCVVINGGETQLAIHPTHHAYTVYKKNGNKPQNMGAVNQLPLTFLPEHLRPVGGKTLRSISVEQAIESDSLMSVESDSIVSIEEQKQQLDATFNKDYNPLDHLLQEASQEQLDELIKNWREMADTSRSDVSDTSIPKEVSDTYQTLEPLPGEESLRIWDASDFAKYLPDRQELAMFQELDTHYRNVSHSPSRIIKEVWKLSRGESYRLLGKPCFVYLVTKYGTEEQKKSPKFARLITEFFEAVDDASSDE